LAFQPAILIVFAHLIEANRTIQRLKAKPIEETLYEWDRGHLLICGMGSIESAIQVSRHLHRCDEVWSVGFAGGLRSELGLGQFGWIGSAQKYFSFAPETSEHSSSIAYRCHPPISFEEGPWQLITSDYPIHHQKIRNELAEQFHVVDMEGYAIARAAQLAGKKCRLGKIVSDPALEGGWRLIQQHHEMLSEELANQLFS
jgi:adenosylhomocysteine nucleosidase